MLTTRNRISQFSTSNQSSAVPLPYPVQTSTNHWRGINKKSENQCYPDNKTSTINSLVQPLYLYMYKYKMFLTGIDQGFACKHFQNLKLDLTASLSWAQPQKTWFEAGFILNSRYWITLCKEYNLSRGVFTSSENTVIQWTEQKPEIRGLTSGEMFWWKLREMWGHIQSKEAPRMLCQECTQPRLSVARTEALQNPLARLVRWDSGWDKDALQHF